MAPYVSKRIEFFLISLLTFFSFLILFVLRGIDDNRLTSWLWTFSSFTITGFSLIIISGIISAYMLTRLSFLKFSPSVFLFLLSFISVMPFWKVPEVILDASRYFTQAKHLDIYGIGSFLKEWGRDINIWTDMPLIPFLYGLIFKLFGESRVYIQAFTTFLFSMTVVLTYNIGKTLWNESVGFYGGVLLLGIPYLFSQIPLMLVDIPAMFFLMLAIFAFIKALEHGGLWVLLSSITIFLAFFSKYSAWLMLSVLVVIFMVYLLSQSCQLSAVSCQPQKPRTYFYRGSVTFLITAVLIGIVFLYKFDVFSEQINLLIAFQKPGLRRWGERFISTFFFQIHPFITVSAIYSTYIALKRRDVKYAIISYLIIFILLFQIKRIRYIIMIFPLLTLMASYGLQEIKDRRILRFIASYTVIFSLLIAVLTYLSFLQKTSAVNIKNAGSFLNSLDASEIEVFTLQAKNHDVNPAVSVPILDLFTSKRIIYHYDKDFSPPPKDFEKSPLRFTWEYKNPEYYTGSIDGSGKAIVVIYSDLEATLPPYILQKIEGYRYSDIFKISEDVFQYKTFVTVYYNLR
ncbi:MAG: glycosyltransferase family 39 protein [Nitrospirae bacterium]|nr:glycosyltransferase family 39 protein [Nitrospirota bacterium]